MSESPATPEPTESAESAEPVEPADGSAAPAEPADDVRRRFREALERKQGQAAARAVTGHGTESKAHGAHGPAAARRRFRRKSG